MAHDEYIQEMYDLVYHTCNKVDFPIDKCTELNHLHMDYVRLMARVSMTDHENVENLVELKDSGLNTYF